MSIRFSDFIAENRDLDEEAFVARHVYPFLASEGAANAGAIGASEPTKKIERDEGGGPRAVAIGSQGDVQLVLPVRKQSGKHATIITVGRGEECDVRLSHPLVSKKHAYFTQDAQGWVLADADSTNGTWADGARLEPHKPVRLEDGTALRFGPALKVRFFSSRAFYEFMSLRARMKT